MQRRSVASFAIALVLATAAHVATAQQPARLRPLDRALAEYVAGDRDVVARTFTRSIDFQNERLINQNRLNRLLGPWQRTKAAFVLELAEQSSRIAPAYSIPLLSAGREYLARNPVAPGSVAADDRFERLWHSVAIGILHRRYLADTVDTYVAAVRKSRPPVDLELQSRLRFATGVAQEQRCWLQRPVLVRVGTPVAELNRLSSPEPGRPRPPGYVSPDVSRRLNCLAEAAGHFDAAAALAGDAATEARIRLAWVKFQLGQFAEARAALDGIASAPQDTDLRYWMALFHARVAAALGDPETAAGHYRRALEIAPRAQAAGVGLALTLFQMDRIDEATAAALDVRSAPDESPDPWWRYLTGDSRQIDRWIVELRSLL